MPTIEAKKILYHGLYSDYQSIAEKDNDILYFCTDVKKLFKGEIEMTQQVIFDFYRPTSPITGKMYLFSASGTAEIYNGTSWNIIAYPIMGTNDISARTLAAGSTSVTFTTPADDEVVDFYTDNGAQYKSVDVTDNNITVTYQAQLVNDVVHMRTYENTYYNTKVVSSLCLDNFQVTHQPNITLYAVGDPVDVTGIQVTGTLREIQYNLTDFIETMPPVGSPMPENTSAIRVIFGAQEVSVPINEIPAFDELVITSEPTKTEYGMGETLDLTGLVVTAYANNRTYSKVVTDHCKISPKNGTLLSKNNYTYVISVKYGSLSTSFNVTTHTPENLEVATWAEIQTATRNGTLSSFANVGDTKTFTCNGYTYHAQLVSINDGTGTAGQYYPAGTADFISVETTPNHTTGAWKTKWSESNQKSVLTGSIYPNLSSELKSVIVPKERWYSYYNDNGVDTKELCSDNLWLPSVYEMSASNSPYGSSRNWSSETANYCKRYEIFPAHVAEDPSRQKNIVGQSRPNSYFILPMTNVMGMAIKINSIVAGTGLITEVNNLTDNNLPICFRIG